MELKDFFQAFFGNAHINFRCLRQQNSGGGNITVSSYCNDNVLSKLQQLNEQNYEIYFAVNSGGYRNEDITEVNAVFVDMDCGRGQDGEYYSLDVVAKYKESKRNEFKQFQHMPSFINETRNGLQVFWLLHKEATIEQFKICQERLIYFFEADNAIKNPSRLMRVPGFYWCKDPTQKFMARILEHNNVGYDIESIIDSLPEVQKGDRGVCNNNNTLYIADTFKSLDRNHLDYL
jgi:hypothetical protein